MTVDEAAAVIGVGASRERSLLRQGRLQPAYRRLRPGEKGPPRWSIVATAVMAYRPDAAWRVHPGPPPPPDGFVTVATFAARSGLSYGALHRWLAADVITSVRIGRRRFIPEAEVRRWLAEHTSAD